MEWVQIYSPLSPDWLSPLVAGLPIILLLGLLVCGVSAPRAAMAGLAGALGVAIWVFKMPAVSAFAAAAHGGCFGLLPIGWIVLCAVFLYHLTVRTGQFEIVKRSVAAISPDQRIQALLIAFSFGTFLEGAAGFGTPVAVSAALLIGLGFKPLYAAGLALIANTSPVAFGALGTPIITLAGASELDEMLLSQMAGRQLPLFSLVIPAWLVAVMSGWKGVKGCWPAILVCGGSFAAIQFVTSNFHGPALVDVLGGVGSLVILALFLQFWQPREIWRFADGDPQPDPADLPRLTAWQVTYAWVPWALLSLMVFLWGWPSCKNALNGGTDKAPNFLHGISMIPVEVPYLHNVVRRTHPVVSVERPEEAVYKLSWLSATGTGIFLAAVLSALWLRVGLWTFCCQFVETLCRVRWALLTIVCMLALAYVTKYSGADATLGLAFTRSGPLLYPFFAPLLGWLGVALTGSDTSANALFGSLQRITAEQLGLNPILIVASNSTGGVMGKMIDAQSIVVAAVATEQSGGEGRILRFVFFHSLVLACLMGLLTFLQAGPLRWMIPKAPEDQNPPAAATAEALGQPAAVEAIEPADRNAVAARKLPLKWEPARHETVVGATSVPQPHLLPRQ
jgi:lactate permease